MTHDVRRNDFTSLVDPDAPVRRIGSGFEFTEGPIWHPVEHYLLFSDMPGDVRRRWDEAGGVREVMRPSNKCNGMTYDAGLNLVVCEHATSCLVRLSPDGRREVLASHFEGQELNSPNDVCVRSDGSIYFTDPWFGRMPGFGVERPRELGWQGVFRVSPSGKLDLVVDKRRFDQPNGLCFSPGEGLLYVNDTTRALIRVFDVAPDGSLSHGRLFAQGIRSSREAGVPDGMKCDAKGNVWVTAPGGIRVYSPRGVQLGTVRIPEMPANLHWGGEDWRTLFVCATTSVYAVETKVGANVEPFMRHGGARPHAASMRRGGPAVSSGSAASPGPGASSATASARTGASSGGGASSRSGASSGSAASTGSSAPPPATVATRTSAGVPLATDLTLDPARCALVIQDMQNDVVSEGGAFAESGSAQHAREQNVVENIRRLAEACRARGVAVVHVHFLVEPGAPGLTLNAPLFEGLADANALVRGTWGAAPVAGLEAQTGRSRGRQDAHERVGGVVAGDRAQVRRTRRPHRHRRVDQHVDRAHRAHRRRQGLFHDRARGRLLDDERRLARGEHRVCDAERRESSPAPTRWSRRLAPWRSAAWRRAAPDPPPRRQPPPDRRLRTRRRRYRPDPGARRRPTRPSAAGCGRGASAEAEADREGTWRRARPGRGFNGGIRLPPHSGAPLSIPARSADPASVSSSNACAEYVVRPGGVERVPFMQARQEALPGAPGATPPPEVGR